MASVILCHLCGSRELASFNSFAALPRVTSDCRPWTSGGAVVVCQECGTVQKRIDESWHKEAASVYGGYVLYHQSASRDEQKAFDANSGFGQPRSTVILEKLADQIQPAKSGRMLDLGCGVGVTLRAFHAFAPNWRIEGFDPNLKDPESLLDLPGVTSVHGSSLDDLEPGYRCITCFHVLEHIVAPEATLRKARALLADDGVLVIQVPYYRDNPFDLAIVDHCSHFTPQSVASLLSRAGLEIVSCSTEVVAREITIIARRGEAHSAPPADAGSESRVVSAAERWLDAVLDQAKVAAKNRPFGIFGTSIAGTFVANALGNAVDFFVDEDMTRVGGTHMGKPILAAADLPQDAHVMVALVPKIARAVAQRISSRGRTVYVTPELPGKGIGYVDR